MPGMGAHGKAVGAAGYGSATHLRGWLTDWPLVEGPGHIPCTQPPFSNAGTVVD